MPPSNKRALALVAVMRQNRAPSGRSCRRRAIFTCSVRQRKLSHMQPEDRICDTISHNVYISSGCRLSGYSRSTSIAIAIINAQSASRSSGMSST